MSLARCKTAGIVVALGIAIFTTPTLAADPLAVGQRVSVNFAGGKEGNVVKIGTAADGTYKGCTFIHFDYEGDDTSLGQWFCAWNSPFKITLLDNQPAPADATPAAAPADAPPAAVPPGN